jgi:hypothetical protein
MKNAAAPTNITNKVTKQKHVVNTVKKDNGQRKVKKVARQFAEAVKEIDDPRTREVDYPLNEILFVALVAVVCGSESYYDFETFAKEQLRWLKKFFVFKNGTPAHDTFRRVFELLDPKALEKSYRLLIEGLKIRTTRHIAIDGKTSRGCYNIKGNYIFKSQCRFFAMFFNANIAKSAKKCENSLQNFSPFSPISLFSH